jgi:hypothetical protein
MPGTGPTLVSSISICSDYRKSTRGFIMIHCTYRLLMLGIPVADAKARVMKMRQHAVMLAATNGLNLESTFML